MRCTLKGPDSFLPAIPANALPSRVSLHIRS